MKRRRHEDRVAGVNARLQARSTLAFPDDPEVGPLLAERPLDGAELPERTLRDRLRYGDCRGFGAPEARRSHQRQEKT